MGRQRRDLTGFRSGRLVALEDAGAATDGRRLWRCRCDCGIEKIIYPNSLISGRSKSCGCYRSEVSGTIRLRHGDTKSGKRTTEIIAWRNMRDRCTNMRRIQWMNYGGRGITVCERWASSFQNFLDDMGRKPTPKHSIDRINNDGDYEPGNCRWATAKEQRHNRRKPVKPVRQ